MPHLKQRYQTGFTLIELLVVVVIISLSAGMMLINISFSDPEDAIEKEARRLHALLQFSHQQAIIRGEEYGLRFYQQAYAFMIFDEETQLWQNADSQKHFSFHELPEDMQLDLLIEGTNVVLNTEREKKRSPGSQQENNENTDTKKIKPQVFLLSSGELSPEFVLNLRIPGVDTHYELHAHGNGEYEIQHAD
ncbi:MAG: type II secretion system minor pseudopilin GspH [Gammaproteobacteria bacterium]|nr:type II secretion system minor pseudopilin GspH [Gammaproteobacteria bacterium]